MEWAIVEIENFSFKLQVAREVMRAAKDQWERIPRGFVPKLSINLIATPTLAEFKLEHSRSQFTLPLADLV